MFFAEIFSWNFSFQLIPYRYLLDHLGITIVICRQEVEEEDFSPDHPLGKAVRQDTPPFLPPHPVLWSRSLPFWPEL